MGGGEEVASYWSANAAEKFILNLVEMPVKRGISAQTAELI